MKYDTHLLEAACKLLTSGAVLSEDVRNEVSKYILMAFTRSENPIPIPIEFFGAGRAHSFPAEVALALVEVAQYAALHDREFGLTPTEDGNSWIAYVGSESETAQYPFEAVVKFWNQFVDR